MRPNRHAKELERAAARARYLGDVRHVGSVYDRIRPEILKEGTAHERQQDCFRAFAVLKRS
jgi:hypothetical protein